MDRPVLSLELIPSSELPKEEAASQSPALTLVVAGRCIVVALAAKTPELLV